MDSNEISRELYDVLMEALQDSIDFCPDRFDEAQILDDWMESLKDRIADKNFNMLCSPAIDELELLTQDEIREIGHRLYEIC